MVELLVGDRSQGRRVRSAGDVGGVDHAPGGFSDDGIVTVDGSGAAEMVGGGGGGGGLLEEVHGGGVDYGG